MKKITMTILFAWTLILHLPNGETESIPGYVSRESCEAAGYAKGFSRWLTGQRFECVEEK